MKKKLYKLAVLILSICAIQGFALAASGHPTLTTSIDNPIAADSFSELLALVLNIIIDIGTPIIILSIIFVGFNYVRAQGKPEAIKKSHEAFKWVMVGTAIVIGARVIVAIIESTIQQIQ